MVAARARSPRRRRRLAVATEVLRIERDVDGGADAGRHDRVPGVVERDPGDVAITPLAGGAANTTTTEV